MVLQIYKSIMNRPGLILLLLLLITESVYSQDTNYGPGYQTIMMNNPSLAGNNGPGVLRLSYLNFYPGQNYKFHSVYISYDSYFPAIHGGAGVYMADDYLGGIVNDVRGGFSYSYFLQAGRELFINCGLSASFYHRSYTFTGAVLPDQIDALGGISVPSSETLADESRTVFDLATGFTFMYGKFFGGFSISHLTQPDLSGTESTTDRLKRKYIVHLAADYDLSKKNHLKIKPVGYLELQGSYMGVGAGAVLESDYLAFNSVLISGNYKNTDLQTGFSLKNGSLAIYYNYRFNLYSGNSLMPFSLTHQIGLAFSLNNVEKRIRVKTINFPEM